MKIHTGDTLVVKIGNKPLLLKCEISDTMCKGRVERDHSKTDKDEFVEFKPEDVVANLGKRPRLGTVHGVKVEPLVTKIPSTTKMWSEIRVYKFLTKEQIAELSKEIHECTTILRKYGLGSLRCELEIRNPVGKYSGSYKHRPKAETDVMIIKPEENLEGFLYVVAHEAGHGLWSRMLTSKVRLRWIKLYHEYITLLAISQEELTAVLDEIHTATSIKDFLKEADDSAKAIVKDALRHIKHVHGLSKLHLEMLLNNSETITDYWPTAIEMSTKETAITEYSTVSPEEFFAESFSHVVCGRKIPKKIQAVLDITLSRLMKA